MSEKSVIFRLPSELLERAFSFLVDDKQAISNCRLVCTIFKNHSSPFLITKVVFAKRLEAITHLQEVLEHPYFQKHVTKLVYDASWFHGGLAESWREYVEACETAPQEFDDLQWPARLHADDAAFQTICRRTARRADKKSQQCPGPDESALELRNTESAMHAYILGCHKSFPHYQMLSTAEERIQYADVATHVLSDAFAQLPKLKSIAITDWRGLVQPGESYSECASRLFGNTLAPEHMDANRGEYSCFYEIASAALAVPSANIESFTIGPHPFEHGKVHDKSKHQDAQDSNFLPTDLLNVFGTLITHSLFSGLRHLCLGLEFPQTAIPPGSNDASSMRDILAKSSHLTHLTLRSHRPLRVVNDVIQKSASQFIAVFSNWHFQHLRLLDLRL